MAETTGGNMASSSSTAIGRPGRPPRSVQVSTTTFPCALHCPAWRLADVSDACHRPRVQEMVSEASCHLFFIRRASTPCSSFGRRGWPMSAMRARGELRMSGMGAGELCEGPCRSVGAAGSCASGCSRTFHCGFPRVSVCFVILAMLVVSACRVKCMSIL